MNQKGIRKGISPLIAAVLLIAFTMSVAAIAGSFITNLLQITTEGVSDNANTVVSATDLGLDVQSVNFDKASGNLSVIVQNKGESIGDNTNVSVAVLADAPVNEQFSVDLGQTEIETLEIPVDDPGSIRKVVTSLTDYPVSAEIEPSISVSKTAWNYDTDGDGDLETAEYYGQGTASDPYEIRSLTALQAIEKNSTTRSNSYCLNSDIDASPTSSWNSGKGFDPINSYSETFSGNDHTITNLTIDRPTESSVGLFSNVKTDGLIQKIDVKNASVYGERQTGAIVGDNSGTVSSCTATEIYTNTSNGRGSLLVGFNNAGGTIEKCGSSGEIKDLSGNEIGGVTGYNNGGTIRDVYSRVNVTHDQNFQVAGVTGVNTPDGTIENAYAVTNIDGNQNFEVEGLIGDERGGTVNNLYLDVDASNKGTGVGTELSTSEMTGDSAADNMNGFDFQNVWRTVNGEYPKLR